MSPDNVALNKAAIIERCLRRMRQEHDADPTLADVTHLDALTFNIERACQATIDLAMHVVADEHLGMPQGSADAFALLQRAGKLDAALARRLAGMTGFRNLAVHEYQQIDPAVIHYIVREGWNDLVHFCRTLGLDLRP